jgi:hypothetical protein
MSRLWASAPGHQKCANPVCMHQVRNGVRYCCAACDLAHAGNYDIHDAGPLAHSQACMNNYRHRGPVREVK